MYCVIVIAKKYFVALKLFENSCSVPVDGPLWVRCDRSGAVK